MKRKLEPDFEKLRLQEENNQLRKQLKLLQAPTKKTNILSVGEVLQNIINKIQWPAYASLKLPTLQIDFNGPHANKIRRSNVKAAPRSLTTPNMLHYRLGDEGFIKGKSLEQFLNECPEKVVVMLGPSGGGKTRKIFELLHKQFGYFILHKQDGDKNDGSFALATVMDLLQSEAASWADDATEKEYERRRSRGEFAIRCVLIAYAAIFKEWIRVKGRTGYKRTPYQWLLLQLYPDAYLQSDVFRAIAQDLFENCTEEDVLQYNGFPSQLKICAIDEAQVFGKKMKDKFLTRTLDRKRSEGKRPLLSAILSGTRKALRDSTIVLSGTGLTLMEEYKSVTSQVGAGRDFVFRDFPILNVLEVQDLLDKFLLIGDMPLVCKILVGRPRFTTLFINKAIEGNKLINEYCPEYLKYMTEESGEQGQPKTIGDVFNRLKNESNTLRLGLQADAEDGKEIPNPYYEALTDAFLHLIGIKPNPRNSPALIEWGAAYSNKENSQEFEIKNETLILETAWKRIQDIGDTFERQFLGCVRHNASALGKDFEAVAALRLMKFFREINFQTFLNDLSLPPRFQGTWVLESRQPGDPLIRNLSGDVNFYWWINSDRDCVAFPSNNTGPDIAFVLRRSDDRKKKLYVFVQCKTDNENDLEKGLNVIDPLKLSHKLRGSDKEAVWPSCEEEHGAFMRNIRENSIPIVRMLVSATITFSAKTELVKRGDTVDVQMIVDKNDHDNIFGTLFETVRNYKLH